MIIQKKVLLAPYTTFRIGGPAKFFCVVKTDEELLEAVRYSKLNKLPIFILGGGSNILVSDSGFEGLVIKVEFEGINYDGNIISVCAGEKWDKFVEDTIKHSFCGLENLSAIPGTVGAAPVQNIGAYGVEVGNMIDKVRVFDTRDEKFYFLSKNDCKFEYRDSLFKKERARFIITDVFFKLNRDNKVDISYRDLQLYFSNKGLNNPTPSEVRNAVIFIRKEKLPDWNTWYTAGSFFKNPIIGLQQYIELKQKYPDLPNFPSSNYDTVKIPLAWILDKICHVRGMTLGNAFVYEKQALVLVAKPGAKAVEVIELSKKIQNLVKEKTGINIEAEVEWVV